MLQQTKSISLPNWRRTLANVITDVEELLDLLGLQASDLPASSASAREFACRVPISFISRMTYGDPNDPLLKQVLPIAAELLPSAGYSLDPLGEAAVNPIPGLLHKYHGRVLLTLIGSCGVNCRYCFRRHFPYDANTPSRAKWQQALDYIAADQTIAEVILSGGDPLVADDEYLAEFVARLVAIPHLTTLRIHTRMPVVIPERITDALCQWFCGSRLQPVMVIHCNHPNEIDDTVARGMQLLTQHGATLLNQSVLLAGVNDEVDTLQHLSTQLFATGVLPYYLHLLDKVQGAAHFEVDESKAVSLHKALASRLPGYLVPKLVREIPGASAKTSGGL